MILKSNSQQFVKEDSSAHWYQLNADGTIIARHEADLRTARKENLFASPTSIEKDVRANPQLLRWIKNEIAKSFINNPRQDGEGDNAYGERILKIADSARDEAATRGTDIHAAIEKSGTADPIIMPFYNAYLPWERANIKQTYYSEVKMADPRIGVAGTVDKIVEHMTHGLCILDFKTQKVKEGKASFYDSFPRQLSFYAESYKLKYGTRPRIMSVVIDSQVPSEPQEKLYTPEEQDQAYKEFLCHVWLWCASKAKGGFWPAGKWSPSFNL